MKYEPIGIEALVDRHYSSTENIVRHQAQKVIENNARPIIIAGNGPSLRAIDYTRVPKDALVMRVNNFYFEDKYYLGKHVDFVYLAGATNVMQDSLNTLLTTQIKGEYTTGTYFARTDNIFDINAHYLPIVDVRKAFVTCKTISDYMALRHLPPGNLPTSGMMALFTAIAFGFKDIYIAGVDLYTGEDAYAFKIGVNHAKLVGLTPGSSGYVNKYHSYDIDLQALLLAKSIEGVSIRSLCPDSFSAQHMDIAPVVHDSFEDPQDKPVGYVSDFIPVKRPSQTKAPAKSAPPLRGKVSTPNTLGETKLTNFDKRLQSYGPVKRMVVKYGDKMLPEFVAKPIDRLFKKLGIF